MSKLGTDYWDQTLANFFEDGSGDPWRVFCDQIHLRLISDWIGDSKVGRALKTDLFDESAGTGLAPIVEPRAEEDAAQPIAVMPCLVSPWDGRRAE